MAARRAYLDHASTSPLRPEARDAMVTWLDAADPGRVHAEGRAARLALEEAREQVATLFGTRPRQVVFTSGATEAVNAAVYGACRDGATAVIAGVEHSSVVEASRRWSTRLVEVPVDGCGRLDLESLGHTLAAAGPALVHCQLANHEVGTVQPVAEVAELCRRHGSRLHVDAAAAAGRLEVDFDALGCDLMSVSAHKMGGPKGAGALLVGRGMRFEPLLVGGMQERARRAGLENLPAAAGFGAVAAALGRPGVIAGEAATARRLVGVLRSAVAEVPDVTVYGPADPGERLPNLLCLGVGGVEAEPVLVGLDQAGVAAHSGSSCSSESLEPSPVLRAMGADAQHSLRFSVGWTTTVEDVALAARVLPEVVARLRALWSGAAG